MVGKIVATSLTIAIGGSGGVFAPSLFIGGMVGTAFAMILDQLAPGLAGPPGAYGLVGMGAVFAAASRAPITSVLIIFELTGDYQIILPLMLSVAVAAGLSTILSGDTIYTLKLRRRGIDITSRGPAGVMERVTVREAMQRIPTPVTAETPVRSFIDRFVGEDHESLPVVDEAGAYRGVVTARQVEGRMRDNDLDATADSLAQLLPTLEPRESLERALASLLRTEAPGLPVVRGSDGRVVGWLTHRDVLRAYSRRPGDAVEVVDRGPDVEMAISRSQSGWLRDYQLVDLPVGPGGIAAGAPVAGPAVAGCLPADRCTSRRQLLPAGIRHRARARGPADGPGAAGPRRPAARADAAGHERRPSLGRAAGSAGCRDRGRSGRRRRRRRLQPHPTMTTPGETDDREHADHEAVGRAGDPRSRSAQLGRGSCPGGAGSRSRWLRSCPRPGRRPACGPPRRAGPEARRPS